MESVSGLRALLEEGGDRIARRWGRLTAEECGDRGAGPRELRRVLSSRLDELSRLLAGRGAETPALWGEAVRHHGGWLFENGYTPGDLVRHFHALVHAVHDEWRKRRGEPPPNQAVALIAEIAARGAAAAVEDYLRRVRAGRAHLREAGTLETIVSHLDEGLLAFEPDGTLSYATPPAAAILGVDPGELRGLPLHEHARLARRLGIAPAEDPLGVRDALKRRVPARGWRDLVRPSDGQARTVQLAALPIVEEGELRGVVATLQDRTDEVRQRTALEEAYGELRRLHLRVIRRTRSQAAGELAARIGISIMNALNAARLHSRLLADAGAPGEHVRAIERAVDEVADVVRTLQDLGTPRSEGEPEPVDLDDAVSHAVELVRPELSDAFSPRIDLAVDLASGASVRARRADVREVAMHLLLSALEQAPPQAQVRLSTARHGRTARIVLDTPSGLAEAEGLEPVRELAAVWGGEVRVEGARTTVELPVIEAPERAAARPPPPTPRAHRVLIVDDEEDNRATLAEVLATRGFEVAQAGSASEAEAQARARPFEAALVDLVMPESSGWEVVRRLRELQPDVRVALVTGAGAAVTAEPGAGVDVVFAKPVDLDALLGFLGRGERGSVPAHGGPGSP